MSAKHSVISMKPSTVENPCILSKANVSSSLALSKFTKQMHLKERKQEIEMKRTIRIDINLVALSILLIIRGKKFI